MMSKTVAIIANGQFPTSDRALQMLKKADDIICCDGAADVLLKYTDRWPTYIVGDLDSVSASTKNRFSDRLVHVSDQNSNDLQKAFEYAIEKKYEKFFFFGVFGGREDHLISNFFLLFDFARRTEIEVFTNHGKFVSVMEQKKIKSFSQQQISFFTENSNVIVRCKDLKWPLVGKKFEYPWQGALNESLGHEINVQVTNGVCLLYQVYSPKDKANKESTAT